MVKDSLPNVAFGNVGLEAKTFAVLEFIQTEPLFIGSLFCGLLAFA